MTSEKIRLYGTIPRNLIGDRFIQAWLYELFLPSPLTPLINLVPRARAFQVSGDRIHGADQKERGLWGRDCPLILYRGESPSIESYLYFFNERDRWIKINNESTISYFERLFYFTQKPKQKLNNKLNLINLNNGSNKHFRSDLIVKKITAGNLNNSYSQIATWSVGDWAQNRIQNK